MNLWQSSNCRRLNLCYHVGSPVIINTNQKPENSGTQGNDRFYEQVEADEAVFCLVCHSSMVKPNDDKIWNAAHTTNSAI